jgi:acetyl esterase/lipase
MQRLLVACLLLLFCGAASARTPPPIEAYGRLPAMELVTLSPSGDRMAFLATDKDGARKVFVRTVAGQALGVTPVGDTKVRDLEFAGEDNVLVFWSDTAQLGMLYDFKNELGAVLNIDLSRHSARPILGNPKEHAPLVFNYYGTGVVKDRAKGYFMAMGGVLMEEDLHSGDSRQRLKGTEFSDDWVLSTDGEVVARTEFNGEKGEWRLFAGDFGGRPLTQRKAPLGDVGVEGLGRTPDSVLVFDASGNKDEYREYALAGPSEGQPMFEGLNVSTPLRDPQTRLLIGARLIGGGAVFFDPILQKKYDGARKAFPGKQAQVISFSHDLDRLILEVDGGDDSGDFWLVDIAGHTAAPLGDSYPAIKPQDVGPTSMFRYKAADGLPLEGVLTLPPGVTDPKGLPLIVFPHGGPIVRGDRVGFDWWAQAFAARGYAVIQPNYRGTLGYGRAFREAGYGEWGRKMQSDLSDAVGALAAAGVIDPTRVCIVGASYGGYAALAGVTLQQGLYRCAVSVAGVTDMPALLSRARERQGGQSPTVRYYLSVTPAGRSGEGALKDISPALHADQADAPILLIHGKDDTVVPIEQSQTMLKALQRAGKPVEYVELPGEDHWLSKGETRTAMLKAAVAFVERNNPP